MITEVVEVELLRLYHEDTDTGPVDTVFRLQPDGDATRLVVESDYEIAGKMPGFARRVGERNLRQMLASLKSLAEANVQEKAKRGSRQSGADVSWGEIQSRSGVPQGVPVCTCLQGGVGGHFAPHTRSGSTLSWIRSRSASATENRAAAWTLAAARANCGR